MFTYRNRVLNDSFTWHLSCRASRNFAVVCLSFISEMKSNKDTRYKQINCRPDYILERMDIWCRFWKLRCFVIGTWPKCLYWRGEFNAPEGHSQLTKWYETFHLNGTWSIYVSLWDLRLLKLNVFWPKHLLEDWFVSRRASYLSSQKGQITLKSSVNFAFPKIHFISCPVFWKHILKA